MTSDEAATEPYNNADNTPGQPQRASGERTTHRNPI